jgi:uncharacterized protein
MSRRRRALIYLACAAAVLYLVFLGILFFAQRSIIFPGARVYAGGSLVPEALPRAPGLEVTVLATPAGRIETLFTPAASMPASRMPVVIFAHGNGERVGSWIGRLDGFRERGIGVLLVEYPGYGRSGGEPSERAIRIAMDAAYDRISADPRIDATRIIGFGQSLGGGAICLLAKDRPLRALILQSTFPSLGIFAIHYGAPAFLMRDRFDNVSTVSRFAGPILVIHGSEDTLIPWQEGKRLADAAPHAVFKLYACGHGCWDPDRLPFWRDADRLLSDAGMLDNAH